MPETRPCPVCARPLGSDEDPITDEMVGDVCAVIENRCGIVRGIGPAVREALARVLGDQHEAARETDA